MNIINYPFNPVVGQRFELGSTIKEWDGEKWVNVNLGNHEQRIRDLENSQSATIYVDTFDSIHNINQTNAKVVVRDRRSSIWDVLLSVLTVPNGIDVVQSTMYPDICYVLRVYDTVYMEELGCKENQNNADIFQRGIDLCRSEYIKRELKFSGGKFLIEKTCYASWGAVKISGVGREKTILQLDGDYTMLEHRSFLYVEDLSIFDINWNPATFPSDKSLYRGIGFATAINNEGGSQAANCSFSRVHISGLKYGWWYRASIWLTWDDVVTNNLCGVRLARFGSTTDRGLTQQPIFWNIFSPEIGWFHNQLLVNNCNFQDVEVGFWGCPMNTHFNVVTAQGQRGTKIGGLWDNVLMPQTEPPTGVWLHAGVDGNAFFTNKFTQFYSELCLRPLYLQDQVKINIDGLYTQGKTDTNKAVTAIECNNSNVEVNGTQGFDWWENLIKLRNKSTYTGDLPQGAVFPLETQVYKDSTSVFYGHDSITKKFFRKTINNASFSLPFVMEAREVYRLTISTFTNGIQIDVYEFLIHNWFSGSHAIVPLGGNTTDFTINISAGSVSITNTVPFDIVFDIVVEKVSPINHNSIKQL